MFDVDRRLRLQRPREVVHSVSPMTLPSPDRSAVVSLLIYICIAAHPLVPASICALMVTSYREAPLEYPFAARKGDSRHRPLNGLRMCGRWMNNSACLVPGASLYRSFLLKEAAYQYTGAHSISF